MGFNFVGALGSSKSLYNRALVISSYNDQIKIHGQPQSDDIGLMSGAIEKLATSREFNCGAAGTVLRFLSLRLARKKGIFKLKGTERLMGRLLPQLQQTLSQLGTEARLIDKETLELDCDGWRLRGDGLWIPSGESSQFATAILLNAWDMDAPLHFVRSGALVSDAYFQMTLDLVRNFGMVVDVYENEVSILANQTPISGPYEVECDVSSAFAVAALACLAGQCEITNFPESSLQPDSIFITHLIRMGVEVKQSSKGLKVSKCDSLRGIDVNLINSPDLFPVLAVLSCFACSESNFKGLTHLVHKESNRLEKLKELTQALGAKWTGTVEEGLTLQPPQELQFQQFDFNADEDHRLVMAAAVAQAGGARVQVTGSNCVSKSFKGFEEIWPL